MKGGQNDELLQSVCLFSSHREHAASTSMLTHKKLLFCTGGAHSMSSFQAVRLSAILLPVFPVTAEWI